MCRYRLFLVVTLGQPQHVDGRAAVTLFRCDHPQCHAILVDFSEKSKFFNLAIARRTVRIQISPRISATFWLFCRVENRAFDAHE